MKATYLLKTRRGEVEIRFGELLPGFGHTLTLHSGTGMCILVGDVERDDFRAALQGLLEQLEGGRPMCDRCAAQNVALEFRGTDLLCDACYETKPVEDVTCQP